VFYVFVNESNVQMFLDRITLINTMCIRIEILCLSFSTQTLQFDKIRFIHDVTHKLLLNRDFSQTTTLGYHLRVPLAVYDGNCIYSCSPCSHRSVNRLEFVIFRLQAIKPWIPSVGNSRIGSRLCTGKIVTILIFNTIYVQY
jgi:hypothetical protein